MNTRTLLRKRGAKDFRETKALRRPIAQKLILSCNIPMYAIRIDIGYRICIGIYKLDYFVHVDSY